MSANYGLTLEKEDFIAPKVKDAYIVFSILSMIICVLIMIRTWRLLYKEIWYEVVDIFKLIQLMFIILFLLTRNSVMFLWLDPYFEFYYTPSMWISIFFFYYYELINNLWWISFIIHINAWKPNEMTKNVWAVVWNKEKHLLGWLGAFMGLTLITPFIVIFLGLSYSWGDWYVYSSDLRPLYQWNDKCKPLNEFIQSFMWFLFSVGIFATGLKVVIGIYLLKAMKNKLNKSYQDVKFKIIITMITTWFMMLFNGVANNLTDEDFGLFWLQVVTRKNLTQDEPIIVNFLWEFSLYSAEVFLLWFTTDNINFKKYIYYLLIGRRKLEMITHVTIFLTHFEWNRSRETINSTGSFLESSKKNTEEATMKLIEDYESQVDRSYRFPPLESDDSIYYSYHQSQGLSKTYNYNSDLAENCRVNKTFSKQLSD